MIREQPCLALGTDTAHGNGPIECLGMTLEIDEAQRAYFLEKLREKLKDPEFRKIEGFCSAGSRPGKGSTVPPLPLNACPGADLAFLLAHAESGRDRGQPSQ
jgi:hypothetical protein